MKVHLFREHSWCSTQEAGIFSWMCKTQRICFHDPVGSKCEFTFDNFFNSSTVLCLEIAIATCTIKT